MSAFRLTLEGGLDSVTPKVNAVPGTVYDGENFEVGLVRGYTRVDGYERYDGRVSPSGLTDFYRGRFLVGDYITAPAPFTAGLKVWWAPGPTAVTEDRAVGYAYVFDFGTAGTVPQQYYLYFYGTIGPVPALGDVLTDGAGVEIDITANWTVVTTQSAAAYSTQALFNTGLAVAQQTHVGNVDALPGADLTKIPGLFFFNDRTHAVLDLVAFTFTDGEITTPRTTPPLEGEIIQNAANSTLGTIVKVILESGSWNNNDAAGTIIFRASTSITVPAIPSDLHISNVFLAIFAGETAPERAGLYYCDHDGAGGWNAITMPREIGYVMNASCTPSAFFKPYRRNGLTSTLTDPTTTSAQAPSTAEADPVGFWVNPNNILLNDGNYANDAIGLVRVFTGTLIARFSLASVIPADAVITGIKVDITRYWERSAGTGTVRDYHVTLLGLSGGVQDKAEPLIPWNGGVTGVGALETKSYGSSTDRWGNPLDTSEIRGADFGVSIAAQVFGAAGVENYNPLVGFVSVTITYEPQSSKVFIRNVLAGTPTDLEVTVLHRTIEAGNVNAKTAAGIFVVSGLGTDGGSAAKTRLIGQGEQIRTASGGFGNLIALTTSSDTVFTLPGSALLASEGTRYTSIEASPYVGDESDVVFFANGVEYACLFDGTNVVPLGTGLARNLEKPRYVEYTGAQLALGYASGVVEISERGDPSLLGTATNDSSSNQLGDAVTGLQRLPGEVLGIWTQRSIVGLNLQTLVQGSITSSSGGIDYTCVDMGQPVYADFRGIGSVQAVLEYGDFQRGKFSDAINPLLIARLQQDRATETTDKRPLAALPVRNKSQYVLAFRDGYLLRGTFGVEGPPQFMWQRLYTGNGSTPMTQNVRVLGLCAGVTSNGRDVQFFSVDNQTTMSRYVYRFDFGRSYDTNSITSFVTLNPMHAGSPAALKAWDRIYVYGQAIGYATVTRAVATTFAIANSSSVTSSYPFGFTTVPATPDPIPVGMLMTLSTNGRDISIRLAHSSASEGAFSLQAAEIVYTLQDMAKG